MLRRVVPMALVTAFVVGGCGGLRNEGPSPEEVGNELSSNRHVVICDVSGETRNNWSYRCIWFADSDSAPKRGTPGSGRLIAKVDKNSGAIGVSPAAHPTPSG